MDWIDRIIAIIKATLQAVVAGGASQIAALITAPLVSATNQTLLSYGWLGAIIVIVVLVRLAIEDYRDYLAMGVFAVPAILTSLLPLGWAVALAVLSGVALGILHEEADLF